MPLPRKGLGRGLEALIDTGNETSHTQPEQSNTPFSTTFAPPIRPDGVSQIDIRRIEPNRGQPRQYFDDAALAELADSIKSYGIIQPIVLKDSGTYFSIIAGERRFRAARLAGLTEVPAIVKDYTDVEILQIALIENIQRQDLTPIEEASCYKRLIDDYFFTTEAISEKIGKNRTTVSNIIRLLELDERVQELVSAGRITISHARVLLGLKDKDIQFATAEQVAEDDLSVRVTENLVNQLIKDAEEAENPPPPTAEEEPEADPNVNEAYRQAEDELQTLFGAKVNILQGKKKGKIEIEYYSPNELDRLIGYFKSRSMEA